MKTREWTAVGTVSKRGGRTEVDVAEAFRPGLAGLSAFSHVQVLWWADGCDGPSGRARLLLRRPYARGPDVLGVFATRSPARPNPLCVSVARVLRVEERSGRVKVDFLDAADGTPVLDLKPFTPSLDVAEDHVPPDWCRHWPRSREESARFDWAAEIVSGED